MRPPTDNITTLQKQINDLQLENQILKHILQRSGISYVQELKRMRESGDAEGYDSNQGARIIYPKQITEEMANLFYARFWGRQDVYAKRSEKKGTGEAGYYTQCYNFWKEVCPKKHRQKMNCKDCPYQAYRQLKKEDILAHLQGKSYNGSDVIGVYPLLKNGTCRFLVYDFDNHDKGAEKRDFANTDDAWIEEVEAMRTICILNGIDPLVERSRSGRGAHLWIFFDSPISAALARRFGFALLERGAEQINLKSFKYYDRMLPMQDSLQEGGLGNLIALPLQGRALREGNSAFVDSSWNAYPNQWEVLWSKPRLSAEFMEAKIKEWEISNVYEASDQGYGGSDHRENAEEREKPWRKEVIFKRENVNGKMSITLSNGIYIDNLNLKPAIQNQIRRLAAMRNPLFYKNQAMGMSNFDTSQWIYLGQDHLSGYIEIPRGLYDKLIDKIQEADISYEINDERQAGRPINVTFKGQLREEQKPALAEMIKYDNGILHAATAFGKTVLCAALIGEKKVNTLIVLESSALLDQWKEALREFLDIDEEFPEYKTKTGRVRVRKSLIGKLQGAHDSMTGIIDIAMAGSLRKKGEWHPLLEQYGMVIVDECHHAASDTIANVLKNVKAKYVYGVTATPKRADGLEKINYMLIGPIRYSYTAKEKAKAQGIPHLVYPRFTRVVPPRGLREKMHPNEAYEILRNNELRDEQILADVRKCIDAGRTPIILSRYKDHSERLYERVKEYADKVFLMTGNNSKKEHRYIREQLQKTSQNETLALVATGSLVGEGFDFPRLDTLIMAMPVSFRSVVEQYAGRLNRDYEGKRNVIIYDYIDSHIPMFDKMYAKRLKAYRQIGYEIWSGLHCEKQSANAIFDGENYKEIFEKDLLEADKRIVISSPVISGAKVYELIDMLKEKQIFGVEVTIVTWAPDNYGFGDASFWMQLHEEMWQAGFFIKTTEESCENFAIIDEEIIWYGNVHLLGKEKIEDSIMRVKEKEIAAELMELTFGQDE